MDIRVSKDIRKFKTKDVGFFTFKEAAFIIAAGVAGFLTYKLTGDNWQYATIPALIILIVGFLRPYGMSFTEFARTVIVEKITPQCYINETDFEYDADDFQELYEDPVQVPSTWSIQDPVVNNISKADSAQIIR